MWSLRRTPAGRPAGIPAIAADPRHQAGSLRASATKVNSIGLRWKSLKQVSHYRALTTTLSPNARDGTVRRPRTRGGSDAGTGLAPAIMWSGGRPPWRRAAMLSGLADGIALGDGRPY